jgi:hypothetical protein
MRASYGFASKPFEEWEHPNNLKYGDIMIWGVVKVLSSILLLHLLMFRVPEWKMDKLFDNHLINITAGSHIGFIANFLLSVLFSPLRVTIPRYI